MITLYIQPDCLICTIVQPAVEAIAAKYDQLLDVQGENPSVPAYPAVLFNGRLLVGDGAPRELELLLKEKDDFGRNFK
ncbi:hypothetical protein COW36_08955 [bacterium (Candidatus Blackallbacteria) CG17_big_fil_post_rev_8_21_14_2_50_48_46]|uniref:Thioredoxin-like fold domain-containing protein n=1 Tax=bacterium (Candidatus Blackallbacteria) CG17_big_fil_post_rev_8_21_14_2_50_48_46 TaxID=2014261 RepID=A0A2M7G5N4_9BACT|nr:MAG: hypothetical protein COW64_24095 [bacterium (Candidatus Blackallbacteria) CG18_big_fil_WC_8_21_14_2_50_49_26]PIW17297.1 MAG: hypothetical protein COW36_08955 [bacterium (Candidatus Blackallbacteria) CG17_big_fil_post_rev_8_21_14_2_50_48_46]PIW47472.1 MAG: hypothetical protein COW20_12875 [bacterium (Candidatus Blackallbacteria) CG13_big_fil_rev_8_21_14_2_50_49_14]